MTAYADLHLHTTASDGRLSPTHLVNLVGQRGLQVVAVTDHDTTAGLEEAFTAARAFPDLLLIPGIELGTDIPGSEVHVLGYWIDAADPDLQVTLERFRDGREDRARRMVRKLAELGKPVRWERVEEFAAGGAIGRPHVARAMLEEGYVSTLAEAFERYLGRNGPAYADRLKLTPEEAAGLILRAGGVPVLAHPREVGESLDDVLASMKASGLAGMEVYYKDYPPQTVASLRRRADDLDLMALGGTDYHAFEYEGEVEPGTTGPPREEVARLLAHARTTTP